MAARHLHIEWLGAGPSAKETGGVPGVANELLGGLAALGHRIDCFMPSAGGELPARLASEPNLNVIRGSSGWSYERWYSRGRAGIFVSGLAARAFGSLRMRREVLRRHREDPYDVVYQFSNIESLGVPARMRSEGVPLVIHPETHIAGELRFLWRERTLALRCQPARSFAVAVATMSVRAAMQRRRIRRANLLICISSVFRDHINHDYGFPLERTVVVPNPIRLERFTEPRLDRGLAEPPVVLVLGRVSARKGIEDVIAVARELLARDSRVRVRVVGGATLWSDYRKLLDDLPAENAEFAGRIPPAEIPAELVRADVMLAASRYEPFGLTVAEALACGMPVVATSEIGAVEGVDRAVVSEVAPGAVTAMADAIEALVARLGTEPARLRRTARGEAERLFATERVCAQISAALHGLVRGVES